MAKQVSFMTHPIVSAARTFPSHIASSLFRRTLTARRQIQPSSIHGSGAFATPPQPTRALIPYRNVMTSTTAMPPKSRHVLIVGGGPAGSTTAYWLAKAGFQVIVAEHSTRRPYGQGLDMEGPALEVVRKMGVEKEIRSRTTKEGGFALVDDQGKDIAAFTVPPEGEEGARFITNEIEIMRGDLTDILATAADVFPNVTYRYGCTVSEIRQSEKSVTVVLSDSGKAEEFAAVIGADGFSSKVRELAFDSQITKNCFRSVDMCVAYFSMPGDPAYDAPNSHLQHASKGRCIWMRPVDEKGQRSMVYLMASGEHTELQDLARGGTQGQQKAALENVFGEFGGIGPRVMRGLDECKDFHFARLAQIKLDTWHDGRCALVGDAAWCTTPLTGQGTTLAIAGGYMLAGEMARNPDDPRAAFAEYRKQWGAYVEESQKIPLNGKAHQYALPQTDWGIWVLRTLFWVIMRTRIWKVFTLFGGDGGDDPRKFKLPQYEFVLK